MRIAFAGTPDFAVPALQALLDSSHTVVGVLTQPDRPKGRGRQIAASPVKETALARGLPISQPQTLKDEAGRADLASWQPDVLVVVAYGLILPRAVLALPRLGCLNIHASLLPRWRGAAPIQRAVLAGDSVSGVTIMLMDVGLDTGPMLLKKEVLVVRTDTGGSLHDRLAAVGASAVLEALDGYSRGMLTPVPQPTEGITYAAKIDKAEALIDWSRDAHEIERQVRAFNPWPIAETRLDGEQLRIFEAIADDSGKKGSDAVISTPATQGDNAAAGAQAAAPFPRVSATSGGGGTIVAVRDEAIVVQCGSGYLALRQVQRPGRRAVSAGDFVRGGAGGAQVLGKRLG
ncbi:MAG TPA: methionyl-tRNA formyltransferase [Steroidobacteraceae bacterium]